MAIYRFTTSALFRGQINQNVWHMRDPDGALGLAAAATEIRDNWLVKIRGMQTDGYLYTNLEVRPVDPAGGAPYNLALSVFGTITSTNSADMNFTSIVLKFQSALAGRHGRGRYFVGGTSFGSYPTGVIQAGSLGLATLQPLVTAMKARYTDVSHTGPLDLVIAPRASPGDYVVATDILIRSIVGVQRRRNWGVGI